MTIDSTQTITSFLGRILESVHPLMAEGLYLAAVPSWYDASLFSAMRARDDNRDEGILERLNRYSFIVPLQEEGDGKPIYSVRPEERAFLQRHWIVKDSQAYLTAHQRALDHWIANPNPNAMVQAQNRLYHQLFVDTQAGLDYLIDRFRAYHNDRQLAAIDRLLDTTIEARFYLIMLRSESLGQLDDVLTHLRARLAQLRGNWVKSLESLKILRQKSDLAPWLLPYVARAYGYGLTHTAQYVEAIEQFKFSLDLFNQGSITITDSASVQAERAHTMIAMGDANVRLAISVRGDHHLSADEADGLGWLQDIFNFFLSLPLLFYFSFYLGRRVWHPRFWPTLNNLDWIIARLFATGANLYAKADPILEKHGSPTEGIVADEQLAQLYLVMGDADQAHSIFLHLLAEEEAPLGEHRRATLSVGLGQALLMMGQYQLARQHLETSLTVLALYEDTTRQAEAERSLAKAMLASGQTAESITYFNRALQHFQQLDNEMMATEVAENLESTVQYATMSRDTDLDAGQEESVTKMAGAITDRHYPVRYRHNATIYFQRVTLFLLSVVIFLIPVSIIQLETGIDIAPEITFNASPLLRSDAPDFTPDLSRGVVALNLTASPNPKLLVWLGILLFLIYLVISTTIGILAIMNTSLAKVQAQARAEAVRFNGRSLQIGEGESRREIELSQVMRFYKADKFFARKQLYDDSTTTLITPESSLTLKGNTAWYPALQNRIASHLPTTTQQFDFSYSMLKSRAGVLYLASMVVLVILSLLGQWAAQLVTIDIPLIQYSLADLYTYIYLGLFLPPLWWFVILPLRTNAHTNPSTKWPWWIGGASIVLVILRVVTLFRPWLTVPDIYVPLGILLLLVSAGVAIWKVKNPTTDRPFYPAWLRFSVVTVATAVPIFLILYLWREVGSYHFLVIGDAHRDNALNQEGPAEKTDQIQKAIDNYGRSIDISGTRLLGIDSQFALKSSFGIPYPEHMTWVAALNNRAAMLSQTGDYQSAIEDYTLLLDQMEDSAKLYAERAIAYQGLGTIPGDDMGTVEVTQQSYRVALADLDRAIGLDPEFAKYFLWRGVAYHALGEKEEAQTDYEKALEIEGPHKLDAHGQSKAWMGIGWIAYVDGEYLQAIDSFQNAITADEASAEAYLGVGYAYYSLRQYDDSLKVWEQATELNAADPIAFTSLGTLYWRVGTLGDDYNTSGTDRCSSDSVSTVDKDRSAVHLGKSIEFLQKSAEIPGQPEEDVAFTYRTMGQVQFLLRNCPGYDPVETLAGSINFYTGAIQHEPDNAVYWHMRGRLAYVAWVNSPASSGPSVRQWLFDGLADTEKALELDPIDKGDYRPNAWLTTIFNEAVIGTMNRGDESFAKADYELALADYELVASNRVDHIQSAFQAGLAALASGQKNKAITWYKSGIDRALSAGDEVAIQNALADIQAFTLNRPEIDTREIEALFAQSGIDFKRPLSAAVAFQWAAEAVISGQISEALELYDQGIALAVDEKDITVVAAAVLELKSYAAAKEILPRFQQAYPRMEQAASDETAVTDAFKLALIAVALEDETTAARWYNEAVRRSAININYPPIQQSRSDLKTLWAMIGVNSGRILSQMDRQLPAQLNQHPDLEENGLYWRFRAWFKYGLGLSAFRLREETVADSALQAAKSDAERAYELDQRGNAYVQSYLTEGAWSWYYVERGNDLYDEGDFKAALADYQAAVRLSVPDTNADARNEIVIAAFKAGLTALVLEEPEQARVYYRQGLDLMVRYEADVSVLEQAIQELESLLDQSPNLTPVGENILEELKQAQ